MTDKPFEDLQPLGEAPIATGPGIAAIALSMAMKYCEINTVKDGTLYQQYKLEGRNMTGLHLDTVFEVAIKIEAHLLAGSERIAKIVVDTLVETADDVDEKPESEKPENEEGQS
jgi:hypothetical protein